MNNIHCSDTLSARPPSPLPPPPPLPVFPCSFSSPFYSTLSHSLRPKFSSVSVSPKRRNASTRPSIQKPLFSTFLSSFFFLHLSIYLSISLLDFFFLNLSFIISNIKNQKNYFFLIKIFTRLHFRHLYICSFEFFFFFLILESSNSISFLPNCLSCLRWNLNNLSKVCFC